MLPLSDQQLLASAVAMDKVVAKQLVEQAGIQVVPYLSFSYDDWINSKELSIKKISDLLCYPLFVKPATLGSSVGINKVYNEDQLIAACDSAFTFDMKVLVEEGLENIREIECAVLGGSELESAEPGEITTCGSFYTYDSKYGSSSPGQIQVPAPLNQKQAEKGKRNCVDCGKGSGNLWNGENRPVSRQINGSFLF